MLINKKVINDGYMIGLDKRADTVSGGPDKECFYYFDESSVLAPWDGYDEGTVYTTVEELLDGLEKAHELDPMAIPIHVEVMISTVSGSLLDDHSRARMREVALAKLSDEEKKVLGLPPYNHGHLLPHD